MAFPSGIRVYKPVATAPKFVLANVNIDRSELVEWLDQQPEDKVRLTLKISKAGKYYFEVNDWKPTAQDDVPVAQPSDFDPPDDDLPF